MFLRFNHVLAWTGTEGVIPHPQHDAEEVRGLREALGHQELPTSHPCPCNGMLAFIRGTLPTTCGYAGSTVYKPEAGKPHQNPTVLAA